MKRFADYIRFFNERNRGVSPVIGVILMVAVVVILSGVVLVGVGNITPNEVSNQPAAGFDMDRTDNNSLVVYPAYMDTSETYYLNINGKNVYSWEGEDGGAADTRELRCLFPGDEVRIIAQSNSGEKTYTISKKEIEHALGCGLEGTAARFSTVVVNDVEEPIWKSDYEFTLKVDPNGPDATLGDQDIPITNEWHYSKRFDRNIEGLESPVYFIILADNVDDYDASAPDNIGEDAYRVEGDQIVPEPSGSEPTNDIYMVFSPGCDSSELKFIEERAGYDNQILLGDDVIIDNTNDVTEDVVYDVEGVECIPDR